MHIAWIFHTTSRRISPESLGDEGGFWRRVVINPSRMENQKYLRKVAMYETIVRWIYLTTVLCMGEGRKYARITYIL